jgi:hypothetical protein
MTVDLDRLSELAEAATPDYHPNVCYLEGRVANRDFNLAVDPVTVLALVRVAKAAERASAVHSQCLIPDACSDTAPGEELCANRYLRAALSSLRGEATDE